MTERSQTAGPCKKIVKRVGQPSALPQVVVVLKGVLLEYAARARGGEDMLRLAENLGSPTIQSNPQKFPHRLGATVMDRILIVEDDRAVQKAVKRLFEAEGYTVQIASDGNAALEAFQIDAPSAVVLDLRLPSIFGREGCREF